MAKRPKGAKPLEGVERTISILEALGDGESRSLAEIARKTGLNDATALRYLSTLAPHELVERGPSGKYRLGVGLFLLGQRARPERGPRQIARPILEGLHRAFDETVNLAVHRGDAMVTIDVLESTQSLKKTNVVGDRDFLHASSLGKAALSALPWDETQTILRRAGAPRMTAKTMVSPRDLKADLEKSRERGYAIDDEETEKGLRCVGSSIVVPGAPVLAISISFPAQRLPLRKAETVGAAVRHAANDIATGLQRLAAHEGAASSTPDGTPLSVDSTQVRSDPRS